MGSRRSNETQKKEGRLGAALLALTGCALAGTAVKLSLSAHDRDIRIIVGLALVASSLGALVLPWQRLPRRALLLNPAVILLATGIVGWSTESLAQSFPALAALCVLYIGLTQRPGTTLLAMPLLVGDWWLAYPSHPADVLVRLPVVVIVLLILGEFIAISRHRSEQELAALRNVALTDPLTQLGNRRRLAAELASLPVGGLVMFVDLDHFKTFNDRYGHGAGDLVLTQFAQVATHGVRSTDLVARFGGEEFVIVVRDSTRGKQIYDRIRETWNVTGGPVTFSAGIAHRAADESGEATMERADQALYRAKLNGRDRVEFDGPQFDDSDGVGTLQSLAESLYEQSR